MTKRRYAAFEFLATAVVVVDLQGQVRHLNASAEDTLGVSRRSLLKTRLAPLFTEPEVFESAVAGAGEAAFSAMRYDATIHRADAIAELLPVHVVVARGDGEDDVVVELLPLDQRTRQQRETRLFDQAQANKELIRSLAHEIKNPLGGIRGAAQLLQMELESRELKDYTQVIIHEADRLQSLVDRLLAPHRKPHVVGDVNIHEVLERVRTLVLAEYPRGLKVLRDYDTSLPEFRGDKEQLIQAVLNVAQNAAQVLSAERAQGRAEILLRTRVARQITLGKTRYKLALELHVIDNGPGVPEAIRDRLFYPLVSGRDGGTGLGLTLAQTFVQQHQGLIECVSQPGFTDFRILIPLP
jgi:two-component system, NtrC family, nitrogen regulation sensor histidine kinase GlnL